MRTRDEIIEEMYSEINGRPSLGNEVRLGVIVETLLEIRDLLSKGKEVS